MRFVWQKVFGFARRRLAVITTLACAITTPPSFAGSPPDQATAPPSNPELRKVLDVPYGRDKLQKFDVYAPLQARGAPAIFMVHGGAWTIGDKSYGRVTENKLARWIPRGIIVISVNYRMLPDAKPLEQALDVARALAVAQDQAAGWGADRSKFVLMGHSAGAHLVTLLAASPEIATQLGASPWLGTVSLDSAVYDLELLMSTRHPRLYDRAFGSDPAQWKAVSPYAVLKRAGPPFLGVCSTRRGDACPQAQRFVDRASALGTRAQVLAQDMSHGDINQRLGEEPAYTEAVEAFLRSLDDSFVQTLGNKSKVH